MEASRTFKFRPAIWRRVRASRSPAPLDGGRSRPVDRHHSEARAHGRDDVPDQMFGITPPPRTAPRPIGAPSPGLVRWQPSSLQAHGPFGRTR
jgi:hypothetical protein